MVNSIPILTEDENSLIRVLFQMFLNQLRNKSRFRMAFIHGLNCLSEVVNDLLLEKSTGRTLTVSELFVGSLEVRTGGSKPLCLQQVEQHMHSPNIRNPSCSIVASWVSTRDGNACPLCGFLNQTRSEMFCWSKKPLSFQRIRFFELMCFKRLQQGQSFRVKHDSYRCNVHVHCIGFQQVIFSLCHEDSINVQSIPQLSNGILRRTRACCGSDQPWLG